MVYDEGTDSYTQPGVKLIVEEVDDSLVITYAQLGVEDIFNLCVELIDRVARITGQSYNETVADFKEIEEESI